MEHLNDGFEITMEINGQATEVLFSYEEYHRPQWCLYFQDGCKSATIVMYYDKSIGWFRDEMSDSRYAPYEHLFDHAIKETLRRRTFLRNIAANQ